MEIDEGESAGIGYATRPTVWCLDNCLYCFLKFFEKLSTYSRVAIKLPICRCLNFRSRIRMNSTFLPTIIAELG